MAQAGPGLFISHSSDRTGIVNGLIRPSIGLCGCKPAQDAVKLFIIHTCFS
jgi:hypothetical protein